MTDTAEMRNVLAQILSDLPSRRDWLDPVLEQRVRDLLVKPASVPDAERWHAASGDWRETSLAIHGERSGYIICGIPEDKAHAIIEAHNAGLAMSATKEY